LQEGLDALGDLRGGRRTADNAPRQASPHHVTIWPPPKFSRSSAFFGKRRHCGPNPKISGPCRHRDRSFAISAGQRSELDGFMPSDKSSNGQSREPWVPCRPSHPTCWAELTAKPASPGFGGPRFRTDCRR
jgi:hypothetical protein